MTEVKPHGIHPSPPAPAIPSHLSYADEHGSPSSLPPWLQPDREQIAAALPPLQLVP